VPASFFIMIFGRRLVGRKMPLFVMPCLGLASVAALLVPSAPVIIVGAALAGFAAAFMLILTLALPPLLVRQDEVHRMAAGMLAIGYTLTFIVPYLGGAVWDATRVNAAALLPGVVGSLIVVAIAATFRLTPEG
jgi:CP family cyanate transporter-like MFS transporter